MFGPWKSSAKKFANELWRKKNYDFLNNLFSGWHMDDTIGPDEHGVYHIQIDADGKNCRFPMGRATAVRRGYFMVLDSSKTEDGVFIPEILITDEVDADGGYAGPVVVDGVRSGPVDSGTVGLVALNDYNVWAVCFLDGSASTQVEYAATKIGDDPPPSPDGAYQSFNVLLARAFVSETGVAVVQEHFGEIRLTSGPVWSRHLIFCGADGGEMELEGETLFVDIATGESAWSRGELEDDAEVNEYEVGIDDGDGNFTLRPGRVCGDIRIDLAPFHAPVEA